MATLSIPKNYAAGSVLQKDHLDAMVSAIETFVNTTQLDYENLDWNSVVVSLTSTQANYVTADAGFGDLTTASLSSTSTMTSTSVDYVTLALPSAGTYFLTGLVSCEIQETLVFNGGVGGYIDNFTLSLEIVDVSTSATVLNVAPQLNTLLSGSTLIRSGATSSFCTVVTAATATSYALRGYMITGTGTIYAGSCIQAFRLRSA